MQFKSSKPKPEYREFTVSRVRFIRILVAALGTGLHVSKNIADVVWEFYGLSGEQKMGYRDLYEGLRLARLINGKVANFKKFG